MAQEIVNRLFAGVKCAGDGTILARTAAIQGVVRNGAGDYTLTLNEAIGSPECAWGQCPDGVAGTVLAQTVQRLSETQFQIRIYNNTVPVDPAGGWNLAIHRDNSANGR